MPTVPQPASTQAFTWLSPGAGPTIIAGPCSVETFEQWTATAQGLAQLGIRYLRAGVWKPRSRPNSFEGLGTLALQWMQDFQHATGLGCMTEVATPAHVEAALAAHLPAVWIGARTTVNPFQVQELAEALRGTHIGVLVKNPVNPDLQLWLGAVERLEQRVAGPVAACHRGFSYYGRGEFRNLPQWEIPLELRRLRPQLPLLCDPSHIAGKTELVGPLAYKALDLGFDGLMLEVHHQPSHAWSDAGQQLSLEQFAILYRSLIKPREQTASPEFEQQLLTLRILIDEIDSKMLHTIAHRLEVVRSIGNLKKENAVQSFQFERWVEILRSRTERARELDLSEDFVFKLLQLLHLESLEQQTKPGA